MSLKLRFGGLSLSKTYAKLHFFSLLAKKSELFLIKLVNKSTKIMFSHIYLKKETQISSKEDANSDALR